MKRSRGPFWMELFDDVVVSGAFRQISGERLELQRPPRHCRSVVLKRSPTRDRKSPPMTLHRSFRLLLGLLLALAGVTEEAMAGQGENMCAAAARHLHEEMGYIEAFETVRGTPPRDLGELRRFLSSAGRPDPWGGELQYVVSEARISLASSGADRKAGTADDLVYGPEMKDVSAFCFADPSAEQDDDEGLSLRFKWLSALLLLVFGTGFGVVAVESGAFRPKRD